MYQLVKTIGCSFDTNQVDFLLDHVKQVWGLSKKKRKDKWKVLKNHTTIYLIIIYLKVNLYARFE